MLLETPVQAVYVEPLRAGRRRILVAEDSSVTHDLLKLLLNQRGHYVDIASDGLEALEALRSGSYDVALLDFHLPSLNGAEIAARIRAEANGRPVPRLIAITADVEGLLGADGCEEFDHVIPKPLDIYQFGKLVEEQADIGEKLPRLATSVRTPGAPVVSAARPTSFLDNLGYQFLSWPDDLEGAQLSSRARQASLADPQFDAILIRAAGPQVDLGSIWRHTALHVLPLIDLTGTLGSTADLDASKLAAGDIGLLDQIIRRFQGQRTRLHRDLLLSDDQSEQLLARVFVSGHPLRAAYEPSLQTSISYNTVLAPAAVASEAAKLRDHGLFQRKFFDRFFVCPRCESMRMHLREECPKCRSADLIEETYLHHYRCAYQAPDSEFRRGNDLTCPKCRRNLEHFGFDYDRPGTMVVCQDCRHAASEPAIGSVCLDCTAHADSESCGTRDAFSYELTDQGVGFAEYGYSFLGKARTALRFAELPIELVVALNGAAKRFTDDKTPFTLVNICYKNEREITAEQGVRQFAQARDLFVENLRAALSDIDLVIKGQNYDFLLLREIAPEEAQGDFDRLLEHAQGTLRIDLGPMFQAFGPEDIS